MPGDDGLVNTSQYDSQLFPGDKIHKWGQNIGPDDTYGLNKTLHPTVELDVKHPLTPARRSPQSVGSFPDGQMKVCCWCEDQQ